MDGVEVLEALQAVLPADTFVPVLVLTGDSTSVAKEHALAAGAKDFLAKPINRTEVLLRVQNLLETRSLYMRVQRPNTQLEATVDRKLEEERRLHEQRRGGDSGVIEGLAGGEAPKGVQPVGGVRPPEGGGAQALARVAPT